MQHPIAFLPGSGDSASIWQPQQDYFKDLAHPIDLPGHGRRADTLPDEVTILDYAQAAYAIIFEEIKLERPIIAGHSLGGAVALSMALEYPQEIGGLTLIGAGARLRVHPDLLVGARNTPELTRVRLAELAMSPANVERLSPELIEDRAELEPHILYRDLAACNVFDIMPRLKEIGVPTLIICGNEDRLTPPKYSMYLAEQIPGAELKMIPDAGHYVMREQPEMVNQAIETWLDNLS